MLRERPISGVGIVTNDDYNIFPFDRSSSPLVSEFCGHALRTVGSPSGISRRTILPLPDIHLWTYPLRSKYFSRNRTPSFRYCWIPILKSISQICERLLASLSEMRCKSCLSSLGIRNARGAFFFGVIYKHCTTGSSLSENVIDLHTKSKYGFV